MSFHDKLKRKIKKGFKEIKKGLGSIANKAADKLVPKELAPVLPLASLLIPGGGITGYLVPQLLTALSTGKTRGDISLTGQALTGLGSVLKDPGAEFGPFGSKRVVDPASEISFDPGYYTETMEVPKTFADLKDPSLLDAFKEDLRLARQFVQGTGPVTDRAVIDGKIVQQNVLDAAGQPITKASLGLFDKVNTPRLATQAAIFGAPPLKDIYDNLSDQLEEQKEEARLRKERIDSARENLSDYLSGLSDPTGRFRDFDISGLLTLAAGGRVGMDKGGPLNFDNIFDKMMAEAKDKKYAGSGMKKLGAGVLGSSGLMGLLDFLNVFGTGGGLLADGGRVGMDEGGIASLPAGIPKDMQVDGRNGTFIPMGVKEKADDVPAMLSKNEFVMTADAVRAAGGGSVNKGAQRMYDLMNSLEAMV
jgi:hypothetical protein